MIIGGLIKSSLVEYPGKISAVIFTVGCNFRCPYCHNPELVNPELKPPVEYTENQVLDFLKKRKGKLDAVVITGGEPLIQNNIYHFISKIKKENFLVKIETNGSNPELLKKLTDEGLLDYIAMDIKAPPEKYEMVCGTRVKLEKILHSIKLIMNSSIPYEFITTYAKQFLTPDDIVSIARMIRGARMYIIQRMHTLKILNKSLIKPCRYEQNELDKLKKRICIYVKRCEVR